MARGRARTAPASLEALVRRLRVFVLDTDVVSRTSPVSRDGGRVADWLLGHKGQSFLCVVTITELRYGVDRLKFKGASQKATLLDAWLAGIETSFGARLLAVNARIASRTGHLLARAEAAGMSPGLADACIAACAELSDRTVVTFNARHFSAFGVPFRAPEDDR